MQDLEEEVVEVLGMGRNVAAIQWNELEMGFDDVFG